MPCRCCCYNEGYDEGFDEGSASAAEDFYKEDIYFTDIRTYPTSTGWTAIIDIEHPIGVGLTEAEAIGNLIIKLSVQHGRSISF